MRKGHLLPDSKEVELICLRQLGGPVQMELRSCRRDAKCPGCGTLSTRVHSRYRRILADLPWEGLPVSILLWTRKFFCGSLTCSRKIFTERLPGTVARYARRSCRAGESLLWLTQALGGRAGARLARKLGLLASRATLLRELRRCTSPVQPAPRVVGVDEWAWKKGHRYGTILCDLERGRVIDLLPTRDSSAVAAWFSKNQTIEIVSRDRASSFAEAIRRGAPQAVQVADRWHLLNNLFETLARSLERHRPTINNLRVRLRRCTQEEAVRQMSEEPTLTSARERNRERKLKLYEEVQALLSRGTSQSEASRRLGVSLRTINRWKSCGVFPERKHRVFPNSVSAFGSYLSKRVDEGCTNATQLWREVREHGYTGRASAVWRWLRRSFGFLKDNTEQSPVRQTRPLSPQQLAWLMLKVEPTRSRYLSALCESAPELASIAHVAKSFFDMIRTRDASAWPAWLQAAEHSPLAFFARHLRRDAAAVLAALQQPWSNGMVEGQISRLKLIKRQMYGQAGFDLLRQRVLQPS